MQVSQIRQLSFADDLILFCKVDKSSVQCLMSAFKKFSVRSVMQISVAKSLVILTGVQDNFKNRIKKITFFLEENFHLSILNVRITVSRLSYSTCQLFEYKICAKC